jgi:hypothetical protein
MIIQAFSEEDRDMGLAKDIADVLMQHYPNHLWAVSVKGGVAIVKALNISSNWGIVLKMADIGHNAKIRAKKVMQAGGELLERAGLARTEYNGDRTQKLDGADNYSALGMR